MARPASRYPTELELEILKIIWGNGSCTVRDVRDRLEEDGRELAYTSVMTIMTIMTRKGYLERSKAGTCYMYSPLLRRESATRGMLGDLVERLFNGSAAAAMQHLLETGDIDDSELEELKEYIEQKTSEGGS